MAVIDLNTVPDTDLGPGRYDAEVEEIDLVDGRQAPQLLLRLRLVEQSGRGVTDYVSLSEAALWRLRQCVGAFEGPTTLDTDDLDSLRAELVGKRGIVYLGVEESGPSAGFLRVRRYLSMTARDRERLSREPADAPF